MRLCDWLAPVADHLRLRDPSDVTPPVDVVFFTDGTNFDDVVTLLWLTKTPRANLRGIYLQGNACTHHMHATPMCGFCPAEGTPAPLAHFTFTRQCPCGHGYEILHACKHARDSRPSLRGARGKDHDDIDEVLVTHTG